MLPSERFNLGQLFIYARLGTPSGYIFPGRGTGGSGTGRSGTGGNGTNGSRHRGFQGSRVQDSHKVFNPYIAVGHR
jgi:hypothetical protein